MLDDSESCLTISKLIDLVAKLDIPIVKNGNITVDHLGSKVFNLNSHKIARFAMTFKASIRKLWRMYGNSVLIGCEHCITKTYLSANCNYTNGNNDTFDLDILNGLRCKNLKLF